MLILSARRGSVGSLNSTRRPVKWLGNWCVGRKPGNAPRISTADPGLDKGVYIVNFHTISIVRDPFHITYNWSTGVWGQGVNAIFYGVQVDNRAPAILIEKTRYIIVGLSLESWARLLDLEKAADAAWNNTGRDVERGQRSTNKSIRNRNLFLISSDNVKWPATTFIATGWKVGLWSYTMGVS